MKASNTLKLLILRADDVWIAVSLDHYIMAQGESVKDVIHQFKLTLAAEVLYSIKHGDAEQPLQGIEPAPTEYWDAYKEASPLDSDSMDIHVELEDVDHIPIPSVQEMRLAA